MCRVECKTILVRILVYLGYLKFLTGFAHMPRLTLEIGGSLSLLTPSATPAAFAIVLNTLVAAVKLR